MEVEVDISRSQSIPPHKVLVAIWTFSLSIASEHALQADAHALNVVNRAPGFFGEEVEADYTVRVDVRVYRYLVGSVLKENDFWRF